MPRRVAVALVVALAVASCKVGVSVTPTPRSTPTAATSSTPAGSPTSAGSPTAPPSNAQGVVVDPSLLDVLPAAIEGVPLEESPEGETESLSDPHLGDVATAIVAGLAIDAASGEFVYAVVVRLRPGQMGDERFRDWRDSFDEGACSQAGGVGGHAEADIDGRTVYIGTCAGGVRTYHVWLEAPGLLISASSLGERRFGEKLVEGLRS